MKSTLATIATAVLAWGSAFPAAAQEKPAGGETVVLDTSGFWRFYLTMRTPVVRDGEALRDVGAACNTLPPNKDWTGAEFDDSGWVRLAGAPLASWSHWEQAAQANVGFGALHLSSIVISSPADLNFLLVHLATIDAHITHTADFYI